GVAEQMGRSPVSHQVGLDRLASSDGDLHLLQGVAIRQSGDLVVGADIPGVVVCRKTVIAARIRHGGGSKKVAIIIANEMYTSERVVLVVLNRAINQSCFLGELNIDTTDIPAGDIHF